MNKKAVLFLIIATVLVVGFTVYWVAAVTNSPSDKAANSDTSHTHEHDEHEHSDNVTATTDPSAPLGLTITVDDKGFEQSSYTVKAGETVKVVNGSSLEVQFSSGSHPTHKDNPELNMPPLAPGAEGTFTVHNVGTWSIHDHEHPQFTTTLVVTQ